MARDAEFDLIANDKTSRGVGSARRNFEGLDKDAKKFASQISKVGSDIIGNGSKIGALFGENIAKGLSRAAPAMAPVLAGVAIAAAPVIGASIAGAIIGGAGLGGVIGGVILASRDPRVKAAGSELGNNVLNTLQTRAAVFVEPVLEGIQTIQRGFDAVGDDIGRIFNNTSKFVKPLVQGATFAFQKITQAVAKLTDAAGPVIDVISNGIANLGVAIGDVFADLADDGVSAATALNQVFQVVEFTIRGVGAAINALTETYGVLAKAGAFGRDAQLEYIRLEANAKLAAAANKELGTSFGGVGAAGRNLASAIAGVVSAMGDLVSKNRDLYASQTSASEAIANASKAIRENGRTLDLNTEKGRANRQALTNLASALQSQYDATVKVNGAGRVADGVAASNRASFIKLATQLTGSASKARDLANQLLGIPNVKKKVTVDNKQAVSAAQAIKAQLAGIQSKTITVTVKHRGDGNNETSPSIGGGGGRQFSANRFFAAAPEGNKGVRAQPVSVTNDVNVYLDGSLIDARTDIKIRRNREYQAHKQLVGRVY